MIIIYLIFQSIDMSLVDSLHVLLDLSIVNEIRGQCALVPVANREPPDPRDDLGAHFSSDTRPVNIETYCLFYLWFLFQSIEVL